MNDKSPIAANTKSEHPRTTAKPRATAGPATQTQASQAIAAAQLLAIEGKLRSAKNERDLLHLVADEMRKLVSARQVFVLRIKAPTKPEVTCISSMALVEKDTPFVRWIEAMLRELLATHGTAETVVFDLPAYTDPESAETKSYPFGHLVWQPMVLTSGATFAGLLLARERPWSEQDIRLIARQSDVFANMWQALYGAKALQPGQRIRNKTGIGLAVAALVAAIIPVPMSTLAPVEIVARNPQRVTAPIDGVIESIDVEPNRRVTAGQVIIRFDETTARNRQQVAEQELQLAKARLDRTSQASFTNEQARHDLGQAQAEYDLKKVERDYAADLLAKSQITAERDGVIVYPGKDQLIGKPVRTGERLMQIVDPAHVAARIELPVADAIVLEKGAKVRLFLDANPLSAVPAHLTSEGYQAEPNSTLQLVYRLRADIETGADGIRIGARGTAQLQGRYVPLFYYLLRRPISSFRQHVGL